MADIFISYKKEDAGRVIRIVEALRAEGFTVWWDHGITPGAQWDQTIQYELNAAKVVIAVWSEQSVAAPWVKEEAGVGKSRGILLPIRIDNVEPPLGFSLIQMGDLVGWDGDRKDQHWVLVLGAIRAILSGKRPEGLEAAPRRKRGAGMWMLAAAALLALGAGATAVFYLSRPVETASSARTDASGGPASSVVGAGPGQAAAPSAQEQQAWAIAQQQRSRQAYQTYLVSFPNGQHAQQARDALLLCRSELTETWRAQRTGQVIRGVNSELAPSEALACAAAREAARATGERTCRAISSNEGYRNGRASFVESPCECRQTPGGYFCTADPGYTCDFEQRIQAPTEVCG